MTTTPQPRIRTTAGITGTAAAGTSGTTNKLVIINPMEDNRIYL